MSRLPRHLALFVAAALVTPLASAQDAEPAQSAAIQRPTGPRLISFDGLRELTGVASRVGMLAQRLDFTLEVGADGVPTGCTLSRRFRSPLVAKQLCEVLVRRSRFEPARDAWGTAVNGSYVGRINFDMPIKPDR
jgi:hypothetical protein